MRINRLHEKERWETTSWKGKSEDYFVLLDCLASLRHQWARIISCSSWSKRTAIIHDLHTRVGRIVLNGVNVSHYRFCGKKRKCFVCQSKWEFRHRVSVRICVMNNVQLKAETVVRPANTPGESHRNFSIQTVSPYLASQWIIHLCYSKEIRRMRYLYGNIKALTAHEG